MLRFMNESAPWSWRDFAKEFFPPLIGAAIIVAPIWYFFGEDIYTLLLPYFS